MPQPCAAIATVYEPREFFEWRGLGSIDYSGVRIRDAMRASTPNAGSPSPAVRIADPLSCQLRRGADGRAEAEAVQGVWHGVYAGDAARRAMVSSEGACAAYYRYVGKDRAA